MERAAKLDLPARALSLFAGQHEELARYALAGFLAEWREKVRDPRPTERNSAVEVLRAQVGVRDSVPRAVRRIEAVNFESLSQPEDMAAWGKVQLDARNYPAAAMAYARAVVLQPTDARLRLEHAVAMFRAGYSPQAVTSELRQAQWLVDASTNPDLHRRIITNLVYQCLYLCAPKGFIEAIEVGENYLAYASDAATGSGALFVNLACAYGQKVRYLRQLSGLASVEAEEELTKKALGLIESALKINPAWRKRLQALSTPGHPDKTPLDDDLEVFSADERLQALLQRLPE